MENNASEQSLAEGIFQCNLSRELCPGGCTYGLVFSVTGKLAQIWEENL